MSWSPHGFSEQNRRRSAKPGREMPPPTDRETPLPSLLDGVRVLDFTWVWAGPLVTSVLADLGAEVIKVEHGKRLDNSRLRGRPEEWADLAVPSIELVPYFHTLNRGKRSITVNIKDSRGHELVCELIERSDVLVENSTRGAMERAGLGPADALAVNPRLVYVSLSVAGDEGPLRNVRSYGPIASSLAGLEGLTGYSGGPMTGMMTFGISDPNAGAHALLAVLAGLYRQQQTGRGVHVDVPQLDALMAVLAEPMLAESGSDGHAQILGNRRPDMSPRGIYPAREPDHWIAIAVASDAEWKSLVNVMGQPAWAIDTKLATVEGRVAQADLIDLELARWSRRFGRDELASILTAGGIAAAPVLGLREMREHPYFRERGWVSRVPSDVVGEQEVFTTPWKLSVTPARVRAAAPRLGEHNREILVGLLRRSESEVEALADAGVVA
jgi:crotonobetainyl-CoA:carnitine CoA-transferase CaiB-like acyl-CoA transferase